MQKLIHRNEGKDLEEIELRAGQLQIGRRTDNDIVLNDISVSGHHARLAIKPSEYLEGWNEISVEDLGSTNGTIVNGRAVKKRNLKHEDVVTIGTHEFVVIDEEVLAGEQTRILIPDD